GFGEGATFPTATRAMSDWTPASKRGFAQGITHSCARLGNALTPPLVAWVIAWGLYFRDNPGDHPAITQSELQRLPPPRAKKINEPVPWAKLTKRMLPVTLVYFCYGWMLWLFLAWIPSFFLHSYQLDLKRSALFSSGVFFGGVVGDALGGIVSD